MASLDANAPACSFHNGRIELVQSLLLTVRPRYLGECGHSIDLVAVPWVIGDGGGVKIDRTREARISHFFLGTCSRILEIDSTAETGLRIELPEGSLISMVFLVGSDVCKLRNASD